MAAESAEAEDPLDFLKSLGTDSVRHTQQFAADGEELHEGSFMDHLTETEAILRGWGCPEHVARAGLFHSIYVRRTNIVMLSRFACCPSR